MCLVKQNFSTPNGRVMWSWFHFCIEFHCGVVRAFGIVAGFPVTSSTYKGTFISDFNLLPFFVSFEDDVAGLFALVNQNRRRCQGINWWMGRRSPLEQHLSRDEQRVLGVKFPLFPTASDVFLSTSSCKMFSYRKLFDMFKKNSCFLIFNVAFVSAVSYKLWWIIADQDEVESLIKGNELPHSRNSKKLL